jgi:hypothetical protein
MFPGEKPLEEQRNKFDITQQLKGERKKAAKELLSTVLFFPANGHKPSFYDSIEPEKDALSAIHEIKTAKLEAWIFISLDGGDNFPQVVERKMEWIKKKIGKFWKNIVVMPDKTLIFGDFLIDCDPNPGLKKVDLMSWQLEAEQNQTPSGNT